MFKSLRMHQLRATRWLAIVALTALIPLASGCDTVMQNAAWFWGLGYAHELLFTPLRALVGTATLDFINTH